MLLKARKIRHTIHAMILKENWHVDGELDITSGVDDGADDGAGEDDGADDGIGHSYSRMNAKLVARLTRDHLAPLSFVKKTRVVPAPSGPPVDVVQPASFPVPWSNSHTNQCRPGVVSTIGAEKVTVISNTSLVGVHYPLAPWIHYHRRYWS